MAKVEDLVNQSRSANLRFVRVPESGTNCPVEWQILSEAYPD